MVALSSYLLVAAALFALGVAGVLLRRNMLAALIALILMFNACALVFAAFGHLYPAGEVLALLALAASAAGVGVGVALGVLLFRRRRSLDTGALDGMKW